SGAASLVAVQVQSGLPGSGLLDLALGGAGFGVVALAAAWGLGDAATREALRSGFSRVKRWLSSPRGPNGN
nr:hypothetical protein [Myxococcota bacterium]